jgi:hypothetical protein
MTTMETIAPAAPPVDDVARPIYSTPIAKTPELIAAERDRDEAWRELWRVRLLLPRDAAEDGAASRRQAFEEAREAFAEAGRIVAARLEESARPIIKAGDIVRDEDGILYLVESIDVREDVVPPVVDFAVGYRQLASGRWARKSRTFKPTEMIERLGVAI